MEGKESPDTGTGHGGRTCKGLEAGRVQLGEALSLTTPATCLVVYCTQLLLLYCELGLKSAEQEAGVNIRGNE